MFVHCLLIIVCVCFCLFGSAALRIEHYPYKYTTRLQALVGGLSMNTIPHLPTTMWIRWIATVQCNLHQLDGGSSTLSVVSTRTNITNAIDGFTADSRGFTRSLRGYTRMYGGFADGFTTGSREFARVRESHASTFGLGRGGRCGAVYGPMR